jgi:hypothetical protein
LADCHLANCCLADCRQPINDLADCRLADCRTTTKKNPTDLFFSIYCSELLQIKDVLGNVEVHLSLHLHQTHFHLSCFSLTFK